MLHYGCWSLLQSFRGTFFELVVVETPQLPLLSTKNTRKEVSYWRQCVVDVAYRAEQVNFGLAKLWEPWVWLIIRLKSAQAK